MFICVFLCLYLCSCLLCPRSCVHVCVHVCVPVWTVVYKSTFISYPILTIFTVLYSVIIPKMKWDICISCRNTRRDSFPRTCVGVGNLQMKSKHPAKDVPGELKGQEQEVLCSHLIKLYKSPFVNLKRKVKINTSKCQFFPSCLARVFWLKGCSIQLMQGYVTVHLHNLQTCLSHIVLCCLCPSVTLMCPTTHNSNSKLCFSSTF